MGPRKDLIDPAILRPGRIDSHVELGLPDLETREEIFKVHTRNMPLAKDIDVNGMLKEMDGWSGADIEALVRNAGINAIKKNYLLKDMSKMIVDGENFKKAFAELKKQKEPARSENPKMPDMNDLMKMLPKEKVKKKKKVVKKEE